MGQVGAGAPAHPVRARLDPVCDAECGVPVFLSSDRSGTLTGRRSS